jgi:FAD/FMN-containing dehydrogenase
MLDLSTVAIPTSLAGKVIAPGHADYDAARKVWNGMIDRHPALIVRCQSTDDVVASVNFARDQNLVLAVGAAPTTWPVMRPATTAWSSICPA